MRPPPGFSGSFRDDPAALAAATDVSGPFALPPVAVAAPRDRDALSTLASWASRRGIPLVPRGAGTGMPGGNVGRGLVVDLSGWTRVRAEPDGTLRAGPGARGAAVEEAAGRLGRFFPPLPSSAARCTVGGMVANNAAGARSFRHGSVRRWVEEIDVVFADGSQETLGGRTTPTHRFFELRRSIEASRSRRTPDAPDVRKNSSGYDVAGFVATGDPLDLLVGSEGTLAFVTGARLRSTAEPERRILMLVPVPRVGDIDELSLQAGVHGASACEFLGPRFLDVAGLRSRVELASTLPDAWGVVLLELEGTPDEVDAARGGIRAVARDLGVRPVEAESASDRERLWEIRRAASPVISDRAREGLVSMQFIEDGVVPQRRLGAYLVGVEGILESHATDAVVFGHAGDGNVHVNPLIDVRRPGWRDTVRAILDATVELVAGLGGTLAGEHGDGRLRAPYLERIWGSVAVEEFRAVRAALDPTGIMNPGVVLPLPGQDPLDGLTPRPRAA